MKENITQEFVEINDRINNSKYKSALKPLESYLNRIKCIYLNDPRISNQFKKRFIKNYRHSMKLIRIKYKKLKL
jgi:hypothetical protein